MRVIRREAIYIPIKDITPRQQEAIKEKLTFHFFGKERACEECDFFAERVSDVCERCANYKGSYKLARNVKINERRYMKIPVGSGFQVLRDLGLKITKLIDKTPDRPLKRKIKFIGDFRPGQRECIDAMHRMRRGVLEAPPRSGKCVEGSTMIHTDMGLVRIDSLFEGLPLHKEEPTESAPDRRVLIQTSEGMKRVKGLYTKIVDRTVKFTTVTGKRVRGTENHPVMVARPNCELEWVPLSDLREGDFVVTNNLDGWVGTSDHLLEPSTGLHKYLKPGTSNLIWHGEIPQTLTMELSALMGMLTADGRLANGNSLGFCNTSHAKLRKFRELWKECFPKHGLKEGNDNSRAQTLGICSKQLKLFFEKCCGFKQVLAGSKTIPTVLLGAKKEFMLAFLAGYMSCDGEISATHAGFSSASFKYARQLGSVLTALGYRVYVSKKPKDIHLSHKTKGDRIGKYGSCFMKRIEFDRLLGELPFMLRKLPAANYRALDQDDNIPFLRETLHRLQQEASLREGNVYLLEAEDGTRLRKAEVGGLLRDKRGAGRTPHLNRAVAAPRPGFQVAVNWHLLEKLSPMQLERLRKYSQLSFEEVTEVRTIKEPIRVYDVHVPGPENFFGNGVLNHNTVMGTAFVCEFGQKTLILASQRDWLMGFQETFIGSKTQKALTDLDPKRIKLCKTLQDFKDHDICLATIQTFYSEGGERILEQIRSMFGVILVDEVHTSAADKYAAILAKLNAACIGFSGTPDRKDGKYTLVDNILGKVFHEMKVERERPTIKLTKTRYSKVYKGQVLWPRMVSSLENDKKRIDDIAKQALRDVAEGHMILIPLAQVKPVKTLIRRINELAGKRIAYEFSGGLKKTDRDRYIEAARNYKIKILVGTQKVLSVGINIPRASMLYECVLSSNMPNAQQRFARVLTPMEGKPPPCVRYFLDDLKVRRSCMRAEWFGVMKPVFNPIISEQTNRMLLQYFSSSDSNVQRFDL